MKLERTHTFLMRSPRDGNRKKRKVPDEGPNKLSWVENQWWTWFVDVFAFMDVVRFALALWADSTSWIDPDVVLVVEMVVTLVLILDCFEWLRYLGVSRSLSVFRMIERINIVIAITVGLALHIMVHYSDDLIFQDANRTLRVGDYLRGVLVIRCMHRTSKPVIHTVRNTRRASVILAESGKAVSKMMKRETKQDITKPAGGIRRKSSALLGMGDQGKELATLGAANQRTKPHIARVLECLTSMKGLVKMNQDVFSKEDSKELEWAIQVIRSGKLNITVIETESKRSMAYISETMGTHSHERAVQSAVPVPSPQPRRRLSSGTEAHEMRGILKPNTAEQYKRLMEQAFDWEFDVFELAEISPMPIVAIGRFYFEHFGLYEEFNIEEKVLTNLLTVLDNGYRDNPYHNSTHAADVTQTTLHFLEAFDLLDALRPMDVMAVLIAALAHDYLHPGLSNAFLVNTSNPLALRYNDQSVLESHSVAELFRVMKDEPDCDIFASLNDEDRLYVRKLIVRLILSTDLSKHFSNISVFEAKLQTKLDLHNTEDMTLVLEILVHLADISNPIKPWKLARRWAELVMTEFRLQGIQELDLNLKLSMFHDPEGGEDVLKECQASFSDFFVMPLLNTVCKFVETIKPRCRENVTPIMTCMRDNRRRNRPVEATPKGEGWDMDQTPKKQSHSFMEVGKGDLEDNEIVDDNSDDQDL